MIAPIDSVRDLIRKEGFPQPRRLEAMDWPDVAEAVADPSAVLLLPVGATEQHGPGMPICTDTCISSAVCDCASAIGGAFVAPAIAYAVSAGHTGKWPGTFSLAHETFIAVMEDWTAWAVSMGWRRALWVNSHFGNDASLRVALDKARLRHMGRLQIGLVHTFKLSPSIWNYFVSDAEDLHANRAEADLMLFLAPDAVRRDRLEDDPDRTAGSVFSYPVAQTSLNGVTGAPSEGDAARGRERFLEMARALAATVEAAKTEKPPLDASFWSRVATPFRKS